MKLRHWIMVFLTGILLALVDKIDYVVVQGVLR